mgnify:CR=1 FL=1
MKTSYLYTLLLSLFFVATVAAQTNNDALFDGVTSVYISKKMFQLMPSMETAGLNLINMKGKIESLQILTCENESLQEQMRKDFSGLIKKEHEELMRVRDGESKITFYIKQKGELINELIMLSDDEKEFSVIQLLGQFTLQDIQEITKEK